MPLKHLIVNGLISLITNGFRFSSPFPMVLGLSGPSKPGIAKGESLRNAPVGRSGQKRMASRVFQFRQGVNANHAKPTRSSPALHRFYGFRRFRSLITDHW
jgi:hypothetical protein